MLKLNRVGLYTLALGIAVTAPTASLALSDAPSFMRTLGKTSPPIGHVEYCQRYNTDCAIKTKKAPLMRLTQKRWQELQVINNKVNSAIQPVTDIDLYAVLEKWTYPSVAGDCEDYVLEKRRRLYESGWPLGALLITVVRDQNGDGHAVLTVRTDRGDFILDNQAGAVLPWYQTPYRYVKRQSATNSGHWNRISDRRVSVVGTVRSVD